MKNIIISTFALSCIWLSFTIVASDKSDARVIFEQAMYAKSGGILPKEEYKKLINPFLNKAEKELRSVQFCEQNSDCIECQNYFNTLLNYNVACFQNYVQNNKFTNIFFEKQKIKLENNIRALVNQDALKQGEVEAELQKTEELFLQGNKEFYSALPLRVKAWLWLYK